jgi:predicted RNA methylase
MPNEAFVWGTRIKAVERENIVARFAADRLDQQSRDNPQILQGDLRPRDIRMVTERLDRTYVLRVFAQFEQGLRNYLRAFKIKVPKNAKSLINRVRDKVHIANDDTDNVHSVRLYRNTLIHDDANPVFPVSMRNATRSLSIFMGWLQGRW